MPKLIRDISLDNEFYWDYECAPPEARQAVDKIISMILDSGRFPNSMRVHKAHRLSLWSGYITVSRGSWRLLFWVNTDQSLTFHRLMAHDNYMHYLKELVG